jgi:subtilase family serine protease
MLKKFWLYNGVAAGVFAMSAVTCASAASPDHGKMITVAGGMIYVPESSLVKPGDTTHAHTNIQKFLPGGHRGEASMPSGKYETPASLACVYGLTKAVKGCNPSTLKTVTTGGSKIVAIVDAYDYPTALNDLTVYSAQFGLPAPTADNFAVVYAGGAKPPQDSTGGWEEEEALDIDMAHAMAPGAKVILVEANSNSTKDLFAAEKVAAKLVAAAGGGEVSNSWSGGEQANEKKFDKTFATKNVVYLASAGDSHGIGVPAALDNVIAVGGTYIERDSNYNFTGEITWSSTGGGSSAYIDIPAYQAPVAKIVGSKRGTPDISLVASPISGVWVYSTTPANGRTLDWFTVGGTSVSSPALAGILNNAGSFATTTAAELTTVYNGFTNAKNWRDITSGTCGNNGGTSAVAGWDFCTGVGVPAGLNGK